MVKLVDLSWFIIEWKVTSFYDNDSYHEIHNFVIELDATA